MTVQPDHAHEYTIPSSGTGSYLGVCKHCAAVREFPAVLPWDTGANWKVLNDGWKVIKGL